MTIDPVKIPQNVYVEDRIIGSITLRQIMIVMISSGISYGIWAAMKSAGPVSSTQTYLAWTPAVIGTVFAFVKINGISLLRIVLLSIERLDKPSRRIWVPREGIYVNIITKTSKKTEDPAMKKKNQQRGSTPIEELSRVLDEGPPEEGQEVSKPVNRDRIQAQSRHKPVDDIAAPKKEKKSIGKNLMRDITPPPSHA